MAAVPEKFQRVMVKQPSIDFKEACAIETVDTPTLADNEALVKNHFVGINASDINFSAGR